MDITKPIGKHTLCIDFKLWRKHEYLILLFYFTSLSVFAGESNKSSHDHHDHSSHDHKGDQTFVDGQKLNVDQKT